MAIGRCRTGFQDVVSAGTAEALVSTDTYVVSVTMKARAGNSGNLFLGNSTVSSSDSPVTAGSVITLEDSGHAFNLADIYVDAASSGDDLDFWYLLQ